MSTNDYLKFDGRFYEPPYDDDDDKRIAELEAENERLREMNSHLADSDSIKCLQDAERYRLAKKHNPRMLIAIAYGISNKACGYGVDGVDAAYDAAMEGE